MNKKSGTTHQLINRTWFSIFLYIKIEIDSSFSAFFLLTFFQLWLWWWWVRMLYSRLFIECTRVYDIVSSIDFNVDHVTQIQVENFNENNVVYIYTRISKRKKGHLNQIAKQKPKIHSYWLLQLFFFIFLTQRKQSFNQSSIICGGSVCVLDGTCFFLFARIQMELVFFIHLLCIDVRSKILQMKKNCNILPWTLKSEPKFLKMDDREIHTNKIQCFFVGQ